ncbi:MAG: 3-hydroxyacyl-ACP dehydratase FabZ [Bdellovibrionales bacterium]
MEAQAGITEILRLLPHRFPFLLVDKILSKEVNKEASRTGQKIVVQKNVTFNEPFFPGHFPDMPIMPGVLQIEAIAQACCLAYLRPGDPEFVFFIAAIQDARFRRPVVPGDSLIISAEIKKDRGSMLLVTGNAKVDGQLVVEAEILAKVSPKANRGHA